MSSYDAARWAELEEHWDKKANRRAVVPQKTRASMSVAGGKARTIAARAGGAVNAAIPERFKELANSAVESAVAPTIESVVNLLELINDWVVELNDPQAVLDHHKALGRGVERIEDLRGLQLEDLEVFTRGMVLRWRTIGAGAGAAFGALAMIPVPLLGSAAAITADVVAMQALTAAVVTRVCYAYGYDPADPAMRAVVDRMVRRAYKRQTPKTGAVNSAGRAFAASNGRVNWSKKLREDHRIMEAVEKLLKQVGDGKVPVKNARMGLPVIAVVVGAGTNAQVLGDVAKQTRHYAATLHLAEKYGLSLPQSLRQDLDADQADEG